MDAGQRSGWDHVAHHLHRVVLDHPQVGKFAGGDLLEQAADARRMHLDAEVVVLRVPLGDGGVGVLGGAWLNS